MTNIKITIEYNGTGYSGWQFQKEEKTIQGELEKAIFKFSGEQMTIQGAGRTDAGVHALGQCASFNLNKEFSEFQIMHGINFHLGDEKIKIVKVEKVDDSFNARFTAKMKTYEYHILNRLAPCVLEDDFSLHIKQPLDIDSMSNAMKPLVGKHDFTSFRAQGCQAKSPVRSLDVTNLEKKNDKLIFTFQAQSFLYQQIRIMMGSLIDIGLKKQKSDWISTLLEAKNRSLAGATMPSKGLILKEIVY